METGSKAKQPFLIADSSGLISLTSHADRNYPQALRAAKELEETQATILVPYDVYAETVKTAFNLRSVDAEVRSVQDFQRHRQLARQIPIDGSMILDRMRLDNHQRTLAGVGGYFRPSTHTPSPFRTRLGCSTSWIPAMSL